MNITKKMVQEFESQQKQWGTDVALYNLIWSIGADILKSIGVTRIATSCKEPKKGKKKQS